MGCKVEKVLLPNGESSDLFRSLLYSMPASKALESYLHMKNNEDAFKELYGTNKQGEVKEGNFTNTPKFKLAEFNTYEEQIDTMNYLARNFIGELRGINATKSNSNIAGINLEGLTNKPSTIPTLIKKTRDSLQAGLFANKHNLTKRQFELRNQAILNMPSYMFTEDGGLGPLGYKLRDYGINLQVRETQSELAIEHEVKEDVNPDTDESVAEIKFERIYDMDILESAVSNTILSNVKVYLRGLNRVKRGFKYAPGKTIQYEASTLGSSIPINYEMVIGKMYAILKGMRSPDEMITRLEKAVITSPELSPIVADLLREKEEGHTLLIDGKKSEYKPIATALFTTFAKQDYNMFTIAEEGGNVVFYSSNASSMKKTVQANWSRRIIENRKLPQKNRDKVIKSAEQYLNKQGLVNALNRTLPNTAEVAAAAKLFRAAGFYNVETQDLKDLLVYVKDNSNKFSKKLNQTNYDIMSHFMRTLVITALKDDGNLFREKDGKYGENRNLNALSEILTNRVTDISMGAFYSNRGAMVHPINQASEAQDILERLKSPEARKSFLNDPMYTHNSVISAMDDEIHNTMFDVSTMDVLNNNESTSPGIKYGNLSSFDAINTKINGYFGAIPNKKYFFAFSPTQGDRGKLMSIILPKLDVTDKGAVKPLFINNKIQDGEIKEWIRNQIDGELTRILRVKNKKSNYKNYKTNGTKFNLFTELNTLDLSKLTNSNRDKYLQDAMTMMDGESGILRNIINTDIEFITKNKSLEDKGGVFEGTSLSKRVLSKNIGRNKKITKVELENFVVNNLITSYDQSMIYIGDLAFFAEGKKHRADTNKRFALPFTPGIKVPVGPGFALSETSIVKVLKAPRVKSEFAEFYKNVIRFKNNVYDGMDIADGQGFGSLQRYRALIMSQGLHSDEFLSFLDEHIAWKPGKPIPKNPNNIMLEVLKPFYFRLNEDANGIIAPFNMKYSLLPVMPAYFEATEGNKANGRELYPGMAAISRELNSTEKGTADEVVISSGIKVGESDVAATPLNLSSTKGTVIYNESYRFPQVATSKVKYEDMFGSQIRKLIIGNHKPNIRLDLDQANIDSSVALQGYNDAISTMVSNNGEDIYDLFLKGDEVDEPSLVNKLLRDLEANPHNNIDYYKEALTLVNEADKRLLPLSYPTIKYRLDNLINAAFKNKVSRLKLPGHSAVQITSYGTVNKEDILTGSDLKFVRFKGKDVAESIEYIKAFNKGDFTKLKDVKVDRAEIRVTPKFFKANIEAIAKRTIDKGAIDIMAGEFVKHIPDHLSPSAKRNIERNYRANALDTAIRKKVAQIESLAKTDGKYDIKKIRDAGLDNTVIYRIPTQNKNSMLPAVIKDFLDEGMGGTIQVPGEIVEQSGADFDWDKLYIEMKSFEVEDGKLRPISYITKDGKLDVSTTDKAKAYIVDYHGAILTSPEYLAELLSPNTTKTLSELAESSEVVSNTNLMSIEAQETFRVNNKAGKDLISIASIASVSHAMAPHLGTKFIKPVYVAGKAINLTNTANINDPSRRITQDIEEIQNAALDNASDPLLGKLNIDEFTASTVLLLTSAGLGLKYAVGVVNNPVVRALAEAYSREIRKSSKQTALKRAVRSVKKEFGILKNKTKATLRTYNEANVIENQSPKTKEQHSKALETFLELKKHGDKLSSFQGTMNFESKGTPTTIAGLTSKYVDLSAIPGTLSHNKEHGSQVLVRVGEDITTSTDYGSLAKTKAAIAMKSLEIELNADGKKYTHIPTGTELTRLSNSEYMGNGTIRETPALKRSHVAGTTVDKALRSFFMPGVNKGSFPLEGMTEKASAQLKDVLLDLEDYFKDRGETIITDPRYLKVFDLKLDLAGEMDLITIDKNNQVRIYDTKTELRSTKEDVMEALGYNKEQATDYIKGRFDKRGKQLNGYRGLLRNSTGLIADELNIIRIGLAYDDKGFVTEISDKGLENHEIVEKAILDTRVFEDTTSERLLPKFGIKGKTPTLQIDKNLYNSSYFSAMEKYAIHYPLTVNRRVNTAASTQLQMVLREAESSIERLTEKQQSDLFVAYDTYLATNNKASTSLKSSLSRRMGTKEHLTLTDPASSKATANLIDKYIDQQTNLGLPINKFIENLTIVNENNRKWVTLNNTVARGLTGEAKKEMMFFFEDLMDSGDGTLEETLAKSLADYAIIHYGYSRGFNTFMDLLPPRAHQKYMGTAKGEAKVTLPDFFREIYGKFENRKNFANVKTFVTLYVQNNANKLPLRRVSKYTDSGELNINWKSELINEAQREKTDPPGFVLFDNSRLFQFSGKNGYSEIGLKGVSKFAVEYNDGESLFNEPVSTGAVTSEVAKNNTSQANKEVLWNIHDNDIVEVMKKAAGDYQTLGFTDTNVAQKYIDDVVDAVGKKKHTTKEDVEFMRAELQDALKFAKANYKQIKTKVPNATFNEEMISSLDDAMEMVILNELDLKIRICK